MPSVDVQGSHPVYDYGHGDKPVEKRAEPRVPPRREVWNYANTFITFMRKFFVRMVFKFLHGITLLACSTGVHSCAMGFSIFFENRCIFTTSV